MVSLGYSDDEQESTLGDKKSESARLNALLSEKLKESSLTRREVENQVGVAYGYFKNKFNRDKVDYEKSLRALEVVGMKPAQFFSELFAEPDTVVRPSAFSSLKRRNSAGPKDLEVDGPLSEWFDEMDALRYEDAESAVCPSGKRA